MALFSRKKSAEGGSSSGGNTNEIETKVVSRLGRDLSHILKHARITEKATMHQSDSVFVFDVDRSATKRDIMQAVKALYNVAPRKVAVVNVPKKNIRSMRTGRTGVKGGGRKAYVYLKKGETINIA